jgi:hypothetical protein
MKRLFQLCLFCLLTLGLLASPVYATKPTKTSPQQEKVVELTGRPMAKRPDILLLEMHPSAPVKAYQESFTKLAKRGASIPSTTLPMERFRTSGIEKMLASAGYNLCRVSGQDWTTACANIATLLKYQALQRDLDATPVSPLCITLSAEVAPDALYETIAPLIDSEALLFLMAPPTMIPPFPLLVLWERYVWPHHIVEHPVSLNQWIPTLAEVVGVLPPADVIEPSILPSLTGVGYQRPNDVRPTQTKNNFVTLRSYTLTEEMLQYTHWLPSVEQMIPDDRQYVEGALPLSEAVLQTLQAAPFARVLLVRANIARFQLELPETISVVIKKNGVPVHSSWQTPCQWSETWMEPTGFEFLFFLPAGVDPQPVKAFLTDPKRFETSQTTKR